ncbi:MAG TPA: NADPH-dependent FMN reductase [Nevskiaceae bacterium]|nr:NADPH-dependent FMN reductase [Nevskiaceae bacterium]
MVNIKFIIGSTRPNRFGPKMADWLMDLARQRNDAHVELIDLAKLNLPMLDEPQSAVTGQYENEHTKAWSQLIAKTDGFVFVTPEYNHGYPASLKNAIDYLFAEWNYKPVAMAAYGAEAGGARSIEQLRQVAGWVRMYDIAHFVTVPNYWTQLNEQGNFQPTERQIEDANKMLDQLVFWATHMKAARAQLKA